jgi:hypothetical protein
LLDSDVVSSELLELLLPDPPQAAISIARMTTKAKPAAALPNFCTVLSSVRSLAS